LARELTLVTEGVWVATSRLYQTASTLVAAGRKALLIDPAWTPDELIGLGEAISDLGLEVTCGFSTHAHFDHLLWHASYGSPPRWATARSVTVAASENEALREQLGEALAACVGDTFARVEPVPGDHLPLPFGEAGAHEAVEVIVHDGHVPGHGALWFPERKLLLAADMLSDLEMPLPFNPDDLGAYLAALDALAPYVRRASFLITGHGTPTDQPLARLDADVELLDVLLAGKEVADQRRAYRGGEETYLKLKELAGTFSGRVSRGADEAVG